MQPGKAGIVYPVRGEVLGFHAECLREDFGAIGAALLVIGGADIGDAIRSIGLAAIGTCPVIGFEFGAQIEHDRLAPTPEAIVFLPPGFFHALPVLRIGAHLLPVPFEIVALLDFAGRKRARKIARVPGAARRLVADEGVRDLRPDGTAIGIGVVRVVASDYPAANCAVLSDTGGAAAKRAAVKRLGAGFAARVFRHGR